MNNEQQPAEMTFDTWRDLAEQDPDQFETLRLAAIEAAIANAPERNRERLRRLQWRIDQERRLAGSPMGACLRLSRMMWQAVLGRGGLRERVTQLQGMAGNAVTVELLPTEVVCLRTVRESR